MGLSNTINFHIQDTDWDTERRWTYLDLSPEVSLANNPDALLGHLNTLLTGGEMSPALRSIIKDHLINGGFTNDASGQLSKARDAISLILNSPEYLIQK
jgi:hypothetical protein